MKAAALLPLALLHASSVGVGAGLTNVGFLPFTLSPGQIIKHGIPLDAFPTGEVAITSFTADVVYGVNSTDRVPLSEVYLHHWTVRAENRGNSGQCDKSNGEAKIDFLWGIGSETLGTPFAFPSPTGLFTGPEDGEYSMEVHAIDLRGTPDPLACRECTCRATGVTPPHDSYAGGLQCCDDDGACVGADQSGGPVDYAIRYTIEYEEDRSSMLPISVETTAVPGSGSSCATEYDIARGDGFDVQQRLVTVTPKNSYDVVFGIVHMHSGGVNGTLYRYDNGNVGEILCTNVPSYDDSGFIDKITLCDRFSVAPGEQLAFQVVYDNTGGLDEETYPDTAHTGAMAYLYLAGVKL